MIVASNLPLGKSFSQFGKFCIRVSLLKLFLPFTSAFILFAIGVEGLANSGIIALNTHHSGRQLTYLLCQIQLELMIKQSQV